MSTPVTLLELESENKYICIQRDKHWIDFFINKIQGEYYKDEGGMSISFFRDDLIKIRDVINNFLEREQQ